MAGEVVVRIDIQLFKIAYFKAYIHTVDPYFKHS